MADTGLINFDPLKPLAPAGQATATQATGQGYTPDAYHVTSDQLVNNQLRGIIDQDSPLMQQARTLALQEQNRNGTVNSTMAIGAAHDAVIRSALPIAQADAQAYERAATNTVNAKNTAYQFGADAGNRASQTNAQLGTNVSIANSDAANKLQQQGVDTNAKLILQQRDNENKLQLAQLDNQTRIALNTTDNKYRQLLQSNSNAQSMYGNAVQAIANISSNPNLTPDAKQAAIQTQINLLNEGLRLTGGIASGSPDAIASLNLGQYFGNVTGLSGSSSSSPTGQPGSEPSGQGYPAPSGIPQGAPPSIAPLPPGGYNAGDGTWVLPDGTRIPITDPRNPYWTPG